MQVAVDDGNASVDRKRGFGPPEGGGVWLRGDGDGARSEPGAGGSVVPNPARGGEEDSCSDRLNDPRCGVVVPPTVKCADSGEPARTSTFDRERCTRVGD